MLKEALYADQKKPHRHINNYSLTPITQNRRTAAAAAAGSMRKYYHAALYAIALLSLMSLLFYRHEYNRLRYVLEVLNVYGKPGIMETELKCKNPIDQEKMDLLFDTPIPSWQRINDELFAYSAYRIGKNEINILAYGKLYEKLELNCKVYFEGKTPTLGTFKFMKIDYNVEYTAYWLMCEYEGIGIPECVSFSNVETSSANQAVIMNVKNAPDNLMTNELTLCVAPPMNRSTSRTDMISFINYHQIIGIRHFIVYDNGIPSRFSQTVRDIIVSQNLNLTFTILPWNFPFVGIPNDITKEMIEMDCLFRSYNQVEYSMILNWEEYLVLKYHHNIFSVIKDFEISMPTAGRYLIPPSVFCTEQEDDKLSVNSLPTVFRKTNKLPSGSVKTRKVYISKPPDNLIIDKSVVTKFDVDSMNVNHYRYCSESVNKSNSTPDKSILGLAPEIFDTVLYKEYITRQALSAN